MLHWRSAAARALADEIRRVFKLFDDDETGRISFRNLKRVARELGENMTDEELQEMINKADLDGDGEVNEDEFMRIMTCKQTARAQNSPPHPAPTAGKRRTPRAPFSSLFSAAGASSHTHALASPPRDSHPHRQAQLQGGVEQQRRRGRGGG
jgi:hypothetical protein